MKTFTYKKINFKNGKLPATTGQKILLHLVSGKDTHGYKGTMAQIDRELSKLDGQPFAVGNKSKANKKAGKVVIINGKKYIPA